MKKTINKKLDGSVKLEISLTREEFQPYFEASLNKALAEISLPGFRPGQAPKETAIKYIDQEKVFTEGAEKAVKATIKNIGEENEWVIMAPPEVTLKEDKEGLTFEAKLATFPEVKLGDYKEVAKKANSEAKDVINKINIEEKEVEEAVQWLLRNRVDINNNLITSEDKKEGKKTPVNTSPTETGLRPDGQDKEKKELTDEIAQKMGNFKTAEELKNSIREGIKAEKIVREADKNRAKILNNIIEKSEMEVPKLLIERMKENMKLDLQKSLEGGKITYDDYVKNNFKEENKLEEELRKRAEKELRAHLTLDKIFKEEGLKLDNKEIEEEMNKVYMSQPEENKKKINLEQLRDWSYGKLKNEKVFKLLEKLEENPEN